MFEDRPVAILAVTSALVLFPGSWCHSFNCMPWLVCRLSIKLNDHMCRRKDVPVRIASDR